VWLGSGVALIVGLPILVWGVAASSAPTLAWFVPVSDVAAITCMLVVALLGFLDVELRRDRRTLPVLFIASATAVMWIGHFAIFPGVVPAITGQRFNQATSSLFLSINLLTPLMLAIALMLRGGHVASPRLAAVGASAGGVALGLAVVVLAIALAPSVSTVSATGEFFAADSVVGVAGLIPALLGLVTYAVGLRGDERITGGVLAALTFTALNSISLLFLHARYTPSWYADHVLALLPFVALLAGQLGLYTGSVITERRLAAEVGAAAERRRIGLDIAAAMARETDPLPVVDRLLAGVIEAVAADRVTMLRLLPDGYVVERSVDRDERPAHVGTVLPLDSVVAGNRPVVREAVERKQPVVLGSYSVAGLDRTVSEAHAGILHSVVMPLVRGGNVDGVLIVGRRSDRAFTRADVDQLEELGAIAAMLIRNARLLADAEFASTSKSNFINLAAHELGTPISVIRGYVEMLSDGTLGAVIESQRGPLEALRANAAELAGRVDQLLTAARLDGASPEPRDRKVTTADLVTVARAAVERAQDRARLIGAAVTCEAPAEPLTVAASDRDVGIICDNLINNAMTYASGVARVRVEVSGGDAPAIRVIDNGLGIPDSARERIFDQFYRVENADFGYPAGTGLGLYISRGLARRHGGDLVLERSSPDEGSVFLVRFRRASDHAPSNKDGESSRDTRTGTI
jgi:signal transduction histidine kinase